MKHIIVPLLARDKFVISNVPNITSCTNLLEIVKLAGGNVEWADKHSVQIDTTRVGQKVVIDENTFFHTSAGWLAIPLLLAGNGECVILNMANRTDTGGDKIGRKLDFSWYGEVGIGVEKLGDNLRFFTSSTKSFIRDVKSMFGPSVFCLFCALQRLGQSRIINANNWPEFYDNLGMLAKMGADIIWQGPDLLVNGGKELHGCTWENMNDRHDLATWVALGLATQSDITITGVQAERMQLGALWNFLENLGAEFTLTDQSLKLSSIQHLRPISQEASYDTGFTSEWQVLFSPVLAQTTGTSTIVDKLIYDRMWHWQELRKLGAVFQYFDPPGLEMRDGKPRAVRITGVSKLTGANVIGRDLRSTATLLIAGLAAQGDTTVADADNNLARGYEDFIDRAQKLGALVQTT